jgi:hypothetical protein
MLAQLVILIYQTNHAYYTIFKTVGDRADLNRQPPPPQGGALTN